MTATQTWKGRDVDIMARIKLQPESLGYLVKLPERLKGEMERQCKNYHIIEVETGIDPGRLWRIVKGRHASPLVSLLVQLALYFNVSLDYLVGRIDKRDRLPPDAEQSIERCALNMMTRIEDYYLRESINFNEASELLRVSNSQTWRLANETLSPQIHTLARLADLFSVRLDYLAGITSEPTTVVVRKTL